MKPDMKKLVISNLPYLMFVYLFDKVGEAYRLAAGAAFADKLMHLLDGFAAAFASSAPSFQLFDLCIGIVGAVIIRLAVYVKSRNAKKYRKGMEYGSARFGTAADIKPYIDPVFENNVLLTQTERITMNNRPKQPKYARNKNVLVIGGSGSGKTRFFVKPSLMQMVEHKKYISNKQSYAYIRRTSDRLCRENGLSIVAPGQNRGKSYAEYQAEKIGTSWKGKLKITIDAVIPLAADFDDFLRRMEAADYEIKRGKYISFRAPGQERFTRCKTLGENYAEEAITARIKGKPVVRKPRQERKTISLLAEIESSIKAQQSAGIERWNKIEYLKQAAKTMNFVTEHGIAAYGDLESKVAELAVANDAAAASLKGAERRLADMALLIKNVTTYKQTKPVADDYRRAKDKPRYRREHDSTIILYEAAARALKDKGITRLPDLAALKAEYDRLTGDKEKLAAEYGNAKKTLKEYGVIKQNVDSILRKTPEQERTQEL